MAAFYDNCKMLDKDNNFMAYVDKHKMDWYIKKNLADKIDEKTFKINLQKLINIKVCIIVKLRFVIL